MKSIKPPILLFGTGRCGSTLIQRAINCHEDIVMWGEHEGFLGPLSRSMKLLLDGDSVKEYVYGEKALDPNIVQGQLKDYGKDICWVNDFNRHQVINSYRGLILRILCKNLDLEKVHWGFKEIRYREGFPVFWMLQKLFPDARYLFVFRSPVTTVASAILAWRRAELESLSEESQVVFLRENIPNHLNGWLEKNRYLWRFITENPDSSHVMFYEDWERSGVTEAENMFSWLELETPKVVKKVVSRKVANTRSDPLRSMIESVIKDCVAEAPEDFHQFGEKLGYQLR
jgi:hypothetical protein